jgi:uncharacterized C2H2 Zn-finger protein
MTSKKCISMGLKMNGLSGTSAVAAAAAVAAAMNGNSNMNHNMNGHKLKAEKNSQGNNLDTTASTFMNQSMAAVENFIKAGGGLANANSFLPMVPNLQNLPKYENYSVMNAALLASFPFLPINLNPYHIQNLLKLTSNAGVPNLNSPLIHNSNDSSNDNDNIDDDLDHHHNNNHHKDENDDDHQLRQQRHVEEKMMSLNARHNSNNNNHHYHHFNHRHKVNGHNDDDRNLSPHSSANPEDLIEEVNENDESKLVMDINEDEKASSLSPRRSGNGDKQEENDFDDDEPMNGHRNDMSPQTESRHDKSPSPMTSIADVAASAVIKQENSGDDSRNDDSLRCQHCDKVFNHPAEHLQHETVLCDSLLMRKHEGLMMHMVEAMNNSMNMNINEEDTDDRESKVSTESERKVRVRTAISDEQQAVLKEYYTINPRPNREDFRNIAQRLMLDARVVQVWFQNNRSRERKQNGVSHQHSFKSEGEDEPLDLSMKGKDMTTDAPTTSPRYGTVPMQHNSNNNHDAAVLNLSRKMNQFSPIFAHNFNADFLSRQIPSPNEAVVSHLPTAARNGMAFGNLPLGLPLERLLQFTPEMARNPLLMMKSEQRSPANSLSPGSSEKRSWKDEESRSFDEMLNHHHHQQQQQHHQQTPYQSQRRMPKMKSEIPPDSSEFQFACDICDKAFRKQSSLARHKYEHSGEFPHTKLNIFNQHHNTLSLPSVVVFFVTHKVPKLRFNEFYNCSH